LTPLAISNDFEWFSSSLIVDWLEIENKDLKKLRSQIVFESLTLIVS
jgi:hypothetical protein